MSAAVIEAEALTVGYEGAAVIRAVDLRVGPGEVVNLVGTNGSGKSTLLKTLVGLLPPLGGQLRVLGGRPGARPADVAYLSQFRTSGFVLPLRVRDVVRMGRFANHGLLGRFTPADAALVDQAIDRMGIVPLADRSLSELSGGQQQRAYLAQVLARRARLLVLDEPTAGIDAAGRELYEDVVAAERARGATLVVATHDIGEAERADQVMLVAGRVVAHGPPARVLSAENLLEAFGIGLRRIDGALLAGEQPHAHEEHEPEGYHAGRVGHGLDEHGH